MASILLLAWALPAVASVTLFGGAQEVVFRDAEQACLDVFNAQLNCDGLVQLLSYDLDKLNLNQTSLEALCTSACLTSLTSLESSASVACGTWDFEFNGDYMAVVDVMDLYRYKYDLVCMQNTDNEFCLMVEETWDVQSLNESGQATWPTYTNKTYPNLFTDDADDESEEEPAELPAFQHYGLELDMSSTDYYMDGLDFDWTGHGWDGILEYDEYPLEIQCSECFLSQYKLGIESKWGEIFDQVSIQVWENIKRNCDLQWDISPAHNYSAGDSSGITGITWEASDCDQTIVRNGSARMTCNELGLEWGVSSPAIGKLNSLNCAGVVDGTFCAPLSCDYTVVQETTNAGTFLVSYDNITMTQFKTWNPYINSRTIQAGTVVCVGPPGGTYEPASTIVAPANPTTFTTTATPLDPTPTGTVENCGKYYEVEENDSCDAIALANGITFDDLRAMNPSLDSNCTNLLYGFSYCVALVNDTVVTTTTGVTILPTATTTTTTKASQTSAVAAPTDTMPGTTSECYEWIIIKPGDTCYDIATVNGITVDDFLALNTGLDSTCSNLWADTAYCIRGVASS